MVSISNAKQAAAARLIRVGEALGARGHLGKPASVDAAVGRLQMLKSAHAQPVVVHCDGVPDGSGRFSAAVTIQNAAIPRTSDDALQTTPKIRCALLWPNTAVSDMLLELTCRAQQNTPVKDDGSI